MEDEIVEESVNAPENKSQSVEIDMDKFGELDIQRGGGKPEFEKITQAKVVSAVLKTTSEKVERMTKAGEKQTYFPVFLNVEYMYKEKDEEKTTFERYGGGRLFTSEKEGSRFWVGQTSALGQLITLVEENFDFKGTIKEIPDVINGKNVGIKTEESEVGGRKFKKNIIKVFYK